MRDVSHRARRPLQADPRWSDADYGHLTAMFQRVDRRRANPLATGTWSLAATAHAVARTLGRFAFARIALSPGWRVAFLLTGGIGLAWVSRL